MSLPFVILSIPGLRSQDLHALPTLSKLADNGCTARIEHSFPCVTWPSQCNVLTGTTADEHGIVANGLFDRESGRIEMWTSWNEVIDQPQIWDTIKKRRPDITTASWFPMLAKGCGADYVCMPAPIHRPDGSEDLWCYTKPQEFYGKLLEQFQHFPLQHFWGPLAGIQSSQWIVDSAVRCAEEFAPHVWYLYIPHLDYASQKAGPNSELAQQALTELDGVLSQLVAQFSNLYSQPITWLAVSEYVISDVDHVTFPNRILRQERLLNVNLKEDREFLDVENSAAWAMVDHQFSHVFVKNRQPETIRRIAEIFDKQQGFQFVLSGSQRQYLNLDHPRSGDVVLVSTPDSWQAYYWWLDDSLAPPFAQQVDIHRKPGYDPVELFFDFATKSIPLDATLVKGSHGIPAVEPEHQGLLVCNQPLVDSESVPDIKIHDLVIESTCS